MHLLSLEVWNWRGLEHLCLEGLSPHLNLVLGPNESGKSRLFEALRYALFEPSKGQAAHKRELQSWGSTEAPRVRVSFAESEKTFRVEKRFLRSPHTTLSGDGVSLERDAAEEALAEILGVAAQRHGLSKPEGLGLWPLLWVRQGDSRRPPDEDWNERSRAQLQAHLAEEVGDLAIGGEGLRVLRLARQEAARYWTPGWRRSGEARSAEGHVQGLREEVDAITARLADLRRISDELQRARSSLDTLQPRLEQARQVRQACRDRARDVEDAHRRVQEQEHALKRIQMDRERFETQREHWVGLKADLDARVSKGRELEEERRGLVESEARLVSRHAQEEEGLAQMVRQAARAQSELRRAQRNAELGLRRRRLSELEARRERAINLRTELARLEAELKGLRVTPEGVQRLSALASELQVLRARLEAASARVELTALLAMEVNGQTLAPGESREWRCTERLELRLGRQGLLRVDPGGRDLDGLRDEIADRERRMASLCEEQGVDGLASAVSLERRLGELRSLTGQLRTAISAELPDGMDALEGELEGLRQGIAADRDEAAPPVLVEEAERSAEESEARLEASRRSRERCALELGALREELAGLRGQSLQVEQAQTRLGEQLRAAPDPDSLAEEAGRWARAEAEAQALLDVHRERYQSLGGAEASDDLERAENALAALSEERTATVGKAEVLDRELRSRQGEGLHELLLDARSRLAEAEKELTRVEARAEASRLLVGVLESKRQALEAKLAGPVLERVRPLLRRVFPECDPSFSDDWRLVGLSSAQGQEGYRALSGGAQEQLGMLVRLGLAEVLAGKGRLPVLLDDALVNTDPMRLRAMQAVLYQAARRLQIILFSCQTEGYDELGPERVYRLDPIQRGQ